MGRPTRPLRVLHGAKNEVKALEDDHKSTLNDVAALLVQGRQAAARSVNALMTATYWQIGRRIVESKQGGELRATYGDELPQRLSADLTRRFGRGFGVDNLELMRLFYQSYAPTTISESPIRKSTPAPPAITSGPTMRNFSLQELAESFPLSWTHYVHLMPRTRSREERSLYVAEALRGG
jgi:hypothetical protein